MIFLYPWCCVLRCSVAVSRCYCLLEPEPGLRRITTTSWESQTQQTQILSKCKHNQRVHISHSQVNITFKAQNCIKLYNKIQGPTWITSFQLVFSIKTTTAMLIREENNIKITTSSLVLDNIVKFYALNLSVHGTKQELRIKSWLTWTGLHGEIEIQPFDYVLWINKQENIFTNS